MALESLLWHLLGYGVLPLWLACGLADYICHQATDIPHTSGLHESLLHLLQTVQIGVPMLVLLFCQVNALTFAVMVLGVVAHTVTAYLDVHYAMRLRHIPTIEQLVHGFLFVLPLVALALVAVLHWPQVAILLDPIGTARESWMLQLRRPPFEAGVIAAVLGASLLFGILPGLFELASTLWARHRDGPHRALPGK